jgi:FKBP-type peptidyl-prolyl cis-trans isomerase FklB
MLAFMMVISAGAQQNQPHGAPQTQDDKVSYAIGVQVAEGIKSQDIKVNPEMVAEGLRDALSGSKLKLSTEDIGAAIVAIQQMMKQKADEARTAAIEKNKTAGEAFLADNAKKEGIVSLPDGLQYKIVTAGTGKKPADDDTVVCQYRGTLLDGTEFDSSYGRGPAVFAVKDVIPGFREAVKLMPVGSKWQVFIPSSLAYGEKGAGDAIEPDATLIFEVELVSIQPKP